MEGVVHRRLQGACGRALSGRQVDVDGDGQGDVEGTVGEQRAVSSTSSTRIATGSGAGRNDSVYGQFGENFTVEGLGDAEVCIGDRYQIGSASFEVTQLA